MKKEKYIKPETSIVRVLLYRGIAIPEGDDLELDEHDVTGGGSVYTGGAMGKHGSFDEHYEENSDFSDDTGWHSW